MYSNSQSNVMYSNEIFKQYLMQISTGIVWKDMSRANDNEPSNLVDLYLAELFVIANRGLLNFDIVKSFPREILLNSGVGITELNVEEYAADKQKIPNEWRNIIVKNYQTALCSRHPDTGRVMYLNNRKSTQQNKVYETIYDEPNDYYRMLMGLPNRDDSDLIYNTDVRWSTTTPIHEMDIVSRIEMENYGVLDELIKRYPDKEYIQYLGRKSIDPFKARVADRFEILYQPECASDNLNKEFTHAYNSARQLTLSVYYNTYMRKSNELYDNFLAMCILFMALQTMQYKYLQVDITRDFYDTESLKLVYESYGVPFYNEIPLDYHRKIVKNINKLISYKGSSQVFFDLFNIFDLSSMDIYSYFLTKTHIMDEAGNPSFVIKVDDNGNVIYDDEGNPVLDESNYKIQFSKVKIYDDPALSIADESNNVPYESLTNEDPYWIDDAELLEKITAENFNYLESKYIGIQAIIDLMKITYETAYIFRIVTDNKALTEALEFRWTDLGITCSVYDVFIYLATLYCRYFGYQGLINQNFETIMDTLGYDFEKSSEVLKSISTLHPSISGNDELINCLRNINITNIDSINDSYGMIEKVQNILIEGYTNASSVSEFHAYKDLYDTLMISKEIKSAYSDKTSGEVYETFEDALVDCSPELMQRFLLLDDDAVRNEITLVIDQLEDMLDNLKYLSFSMGIGSTSLINALFKILQFFKSAKAELANYDIQYNIIMRGLNFLKMLDTFTFIQFKGNDELSMKVIDDMDSAKLIVNMFKNKIDIVEFHDDIDYTIRTHLANHVLSFIDIMKMSRYEYLKMSSDSNLIIDKFESFTNSTKNGIESDVIDNYEKLKALGKKFIDDNIDRLIEIVTRERISQYLGSNAYRMIDLPIGYSIKMQSNESIAHSDGLFELNASGGLSPVV